ncbi:unnamed protein product, partial [Amoebophrya sp. A120]|eukprot:GSA120T00017581001.1
MFENCQGLTQLDVSAYDVSMIRTARRMFQNARALVHLQGLGNWAAKVSNVTDLAYTFAGLASLDTAATGLASFSETSIANWDLSKVKSLKGVFKDSPLLDFTVEAWDVSQVTDFSYAFANAAAFNPRVKGWAVGSAQDFTSMFHGATIAHPCVSSWAVSNKLTNLRNMFRDAVCATPNLHSWDLTAVVDSEGWGYRAGLPGQCTNLPFNAQALDVGCAEDDPYRIQVQIESDMVGVPLRIPLTDQGDHGFTVYWGDSGLPKPALQAVAGLSPGTVLPRTG